MCRYCFAGGYYIPWTARIPVEAHNTPSSTYIFHSQYIYGMKFVFDAMDARYIRSIVVGAMCMCVREYICVYTVSTRGLPPVDQCFRLVRGWVVEWCAAQCCTYIEEQIARRAERAVLRFLCFMCAECM